MPECTGSRVCAERKDGLAVQKRALKSGLFSEGRLKITIVRLNYIFNFTDFDPLELEPDVEVVYSENSADIENAELIILPGSKNIIEDLLLLKKKRLGSARPLTFGHSRIIFKVMAT